MYIYKITNRLNNKSYVGKTTKPSINDRWISHLYDAKRYKTKLYNAINKYGPENFIIEVVEVVPDDCPIVLLNEREIYWIKELQPEYNMTKGGDGGWINDQTGKRWKIKDTSNMGGPKNITEKVKNGWKKCSGKNNYQSKYIIHTPWGVFYTWKDACVRAQQLRKEGINNVISNDTALKKYCLNNILLNKEGRRIPPSWRGKYTKDIGFYVEEQKDAG